MQTWHLGRMSARIATNKHVLGRGLSSELDGWGMIVFLLRLEHQEKSFFVDNFIY